MLKRILGKILKPILKPIAKQVLEDSLNQPQFEAKLKRILKQGLEDSLNHGKAQATLKQILKQGLEDRATRRGFLTNLERKRLEEISALQRQFQYLISLQHQQMHRQGQTPDLDQLQFRVFSQYGEDGLLHYIFSMIGAEKKTLVEICCGNGMQCNAANLIINHGWKALLIDGNETKVNAARKFFADRPECENWPPKVVHSWVDAESINQTIRQNGIRGDIDLLSIDLDGNDYWIWDAIDCISPRVVIAEYQNSLGSDKAKTQKYNPNFVAESNSTGLSLFGTSLPALVHLARKKGYRLVARQNMCINAVFMRNDVGQEFFPEIDASQCFDHPLAKFNIRRYQKHCDANTFDDEIWMDVA